MCCQVVVKCAQQIIPNVLVSKQLDGQKVERYCLVVKHGDRRCQHWNMVVRRCDEWWNRMKPYFSVGSE